MDNVDIREVYEFLKKCQVLYLKLDGDVQQVLPFGAVDIFENKLYFRTGKKISFSNQIASNPKVEIRSVASNGDWIRITASLVEDHRGEPQQSMTDAYPNNPDNENKQVFYLKDVEAIISGSKEDSQTMRF